MKSSLWVGSVLLLSLISCGTGNVSIRAREVAPAPTVMNQGAPLSSEVNLPTGQPPAYNGNPPPAISDIHRFYNQHTSLHLFSLNPLEIAELPASSGWVYERATFRIYSAPYQDCTKPLFRCHSLANNSNFVSTGPECEGHTNEGLLGYACPVAREAMNTTLVRYYNPNNGDHLVTISGEGEALVANGWVAEPQLNLGFIAPIY